MACHVLIIGGEGDLAFRKLYPALYNLDIDGLLADETRIICFGRGKYDEQSFSQEVVSWIRASEYTECQGEAEQARFTNRLVHFIGDATQADYYRQLQSVIGGDEFVIYLSTPPSIFSPICLAMDEAGFVTPRTRIVIELSLIHI